MNYSLYLFFNISNFIFLQKKKKNKNIETETYGTLLKKLPTGKSMLVFVLNITTFKLIAC